jgi:hypothetical protein
VTVGTTATATLTISNTGTAALTVSGITYPAGFSGTWAGGTIAAGGAQAVTVTFAPTAATSYGGTVTVTGNQTSGTSTLAASGTGTAAATVSSVALVANKTSPQAAGTAITWTATPTGGTAPVQYKWWLFDGTTWTMVLNWTTTNTYTWTPTTNGSYYVGVWARSAGITVDLAEALASTAFTISGAGTGTSVTP